MENRPRSGRRLLWYGFGVLWIIDGLLQAQPRMFTPQFVKAILQPSAAGQPGWLAAWLAAGMHLWQEHMLPANAGAVLVQLLIGALFLTGERRWWGRAGLLLSILWGFVVWIFGEGMGMVVMGGVTVLNGGPESVAIYVISAILLLLQEAWWEEGALARWTWRGLGVFWLLGMLAQAWPPSGYWSGAVLSGVFTSAAGSPQPAFLAAPISAMAAVVTAAPVVCNALFIVIMLALAVGYLAGVRTGWLYGLTAVWLLFVWWMGQDFGTLFSGTSTDPNTAIPLGLLTLAIIRTPGARPMEQMVPARASSSPGWC